MEIIQHIKSRLVRMGPQSHIVQWALCRHARRSGFQLRFDDDGIEASMGHQTLRMKLGEFNLLPYMLKYFRFYFETIESERCDGKDLIDFSKSGFHTYKRSGITFWYPSIAEDDSIDAYTHWYMPQPGDVVFDAGAHAGLTTCLFSRMVGPSGKVVAFEPDDTNFDALIRNIHLHDATNVVPLKIALAGQTGHATFNMDGTIAAGLSEYVAYRSSNREKEVETWSLVDACSTLGLIPQYVKMDIEGAETDVLASAVEFLTQHHIQFAVETGHLVNREYTWRQLDRFFPGIDYAVHSSEDFGTFFTWARPNAVVSDSALCPGQGLRSA